MAITVLPTHLVNMIAAGEVIERPASVLKELVENALDAGATRIDVAIEDGGKRSIAVTDDGAGMSAEDLALAFSPHATSKLFAEEDLQHITTMGFRGEALASIASVSHAHIRTRRREGDGGHEIQAGGQTIEPVRPCAASPGTTITVRDLFFNTPARRKFLRTTNTEAGHISEQLAHLSLPNPQTAFTLTHNGREVLNLPPADSTRRRISDLFTPDLAEALLPVAPRKAAVAVAGLIAPPSAARSSGKWQYFFLNGRYIRDRVLAHALRESYRGLTAPSRFPVAFLFLEVDPAEVDFNVHPTKVEVRFRDSQLVHGELLASLKDTLNRADLSPDAQLDPGVALADADKDDTGAAGRQDSLRQALSDFFTSAPPAQPRLCFPERSARSGSAPAAAPSASPPFSARPARGAEVATAPPPEPVAAGPVVTDHAEPTTAPPAAVAPSPQVDAIQIHDAYIVAADADGLVIIDQHALHERLIYNDLHRRLAEGSLTGQRLLLPETLSVAPGESDLLERHGELLRRLGIEVAPFGPQTLAVQQFPSLLAERGVAAGEFVRDLVDVLSDDETADAERLVAEVLDMMACKAAVKAGDPLTAGEIESLLARRGEAEKASSCPHGRPTTLRLTLADLEKQFKRT